MRYLRILTYAIFMVALYLATHPSVGVIPLDLQPPPYEQQALEALSGVDLQSALGVSSLRISGGLPDKSEWQYQSGVDFSVWTAVLVRASVRTGVGVYVGMHPRVSLPSVGLERGMVGGVPVLWSKHTNSDYSHGWDAIIPRKRDGLTDYVHVWIESYDPSHIAEIAATLETLHFTANEGA